MLMFNSLKKELKSKLKFQFMKKAKKPQYIEILKFKKEIPIDSDEIEIDFVDLSINEYKVYDCNTKYINETHINSVSIYYNQTNYYLCGDGNQSAEIIFSDFMNKSIESENCSIEYDGIKYFPQEDFGLLTRKRINFINIDMNKFKFPNDINQKEIKINTEDHKSFLISISVIDEPKIIAIYLNNPFIEAILQFTEQELIKILDDSLDSIKKIVYVNNNEDYLDYVDRGRKENNIINQYVEELKKSYEIEKKISDYFLVPREKLTEEQIIIYDKYSDFMAYFPDLSGDKRNKTNINGFRYYSQFYFTKNTLTSFLNSIPEEIAQSDKVKLKYSACRCLRVLLIKGKEENSLDLFEFIDFTKKGTIYYDANEFNKKFINFLNEKSEIFLFFLQNNSGSGINLITNEFMSRISMLNENSIKNNLLSTIPKYAIRISHSPFNACTMTEVKISCINDQSVFGTSKKENSSLNFLDTQYNKRYLLANLMQHEDFGHLNFSINFYAFYDEKIERPPEIPYSENLSPFKYYMINENEERIQEIVKESKISILVPKNKKIKEENKIEEAKQDEDKIEVEKNKLKGDKKETDKQKEDNKVEYKRTIDIEKDKIEGNKEEDKNKEYKEKLAKQKEDKKRKENKQEEDKKGEDIKMKENKETDISEENKLVEGKNENDKQEENIKKENKQEEDRKKKNKNEEEYKEDKRGELNSLNNNEKNRENNEKEKVDNKDNKEELGKVQKKEDEKNNIRIRKTKKEDNYELKEEVIIKGDSGIALSFFLTRGKYQLMKVFRKESINFEELFNHPELPAEEDLSEFIDILEDIYLDNREKFLSDSDSNVEYKTRFKNSTESNFLPYGIPRLEKYD